jgi:hypothetical protein
MAKFSELSTIQISFCDESANNNATNDDIKSITNEMIHVLQLDDNEIKDQIVNDLLESGRQSLFKHQEDIIPEIYVEVMDGNESKLIILLKKYFQRQWETQYGKEPNEWFKSFLEEYQKTGDQNLYESILIRTAQYGNRFMKGCPILSIVLQLLFESIDDQCLKETSIFDNLWLTVTNDGLKSITKYSEYIIPDVMNEQLNRSRPTLFQALRVYYRGECGKCGKCDKLFCLLEKSNIRDRGNLYELALDNVAEHGWLLGVEAIKEKTPPKSYATLLKNLHLFVQQQKVPEDATSNVKNNNTASGSTQPEAMLTKRTTTSNEKQGNHKLSSI